MSYTQLYTYRTLEFGGFGKKGKQVKYSVLGVPFDFTATYRPGSRFGPNAIREASQNLEAYCLRNNFDVEDVGLEDLGDLSVLGEVEGTLERVKRVVQEISSSGKFPIVLGGEHTIAYGCVKAIGNTAILSFDAHLDLRNEYLGRRLSHATFMRRLSEYLDPERFYEVGVRAVSMEELSFAKERNVKYVTSLDIVGQGVKRAIADIRSWASRFDRIYLTVDMDVLDPAYAPGVGNPVPEGLSPVHLLDLLQGVCELGIVGLDVVEVTPYYDSGLSALQASYMIFNAIAFLEASKTK